MIAATREAAFPTENPFRIETYMRKELSSGKPPKFNIPNKALHSIQFNMIITNSFHLISLVIMNQRRLKVQKMAKFSKMSKKKSEIVHRSQEG